MNKKIKLLATLMMVSLLAAACGVAAGNGAGELTASGTISAKSVKIAPEVGGKVMDVLVEEGGEVKTGDVLFTIDSELIQAQFDQAAAAVTGAETALDAARVQLKSAIIQQQLAVQNARVQFKGNLENEWRKKADSEFDIPVWYFTRQEETETAQLLVDEAAAELKKKTDALQATLTDLVNSDFLKLEKELQKAQTAYLIADEASAAAGRASENKELKDAAEDAFDLAETGLKAVQERYKKALGTKEAEQVLEARADVGAAQITYDTAVNQLQSYFIGDDSLMAQSANVMVEQAGKNVLQAEAGLAQAQAALATLEIQLNKTSVTSPISGSVLAQNLEKGELVGAGGVVMTIGNMDTVSLTVYIPEERYGLVNLKQEVVVTVDSFPDKTYMGTVSTISDEAEYTPSNVQTVEGRKSTVFAVEISIPNASHDLKAGMPADVRFLLK